ncbi:YoaK family protein [Glacieibacterium frigidum]|uniref:DUF1275 domain-containing protein n=1 Tax=Glacieibacterium frigidum TaxID=2593303 RepID=A0A552UHU5_9SPHN|nr:DUF1275 family protein [Glacieibacterium frigidum]TRW17767.1 DUF1275 domain-containing protein [Glacieibacterium frigidum]
MIRSDARILWLATGLSALAGFVDATGFLYLGGFFVSFMSGNSTRLAVGVAALPREALIAAGLIAAFVIGVVAGSLAGTLGGARRRAVVLALVAVLLGAAVACDALGWRAGAAAAMALAMGVENVVFERDGEVQIGLTYMTGTLVKVGQRIAHALRGGPAFGWWPYLLLWAGLVAGAVAGALLYPLIGIANLIGGAGAALLLATATLHPRLRG